MIADEPAADAQARHQRQKPQGQFSGRLLQIRFDRKKRKQKPGEHNGQFQNRAQRIFHQSRPLCSKNSINACRAGFKSS